jgi:tetratricopeptide (TPR) repeat protein
MQWTAHKLVASLPRGKKIRKIHLRTAADEDQASTSPLLGAQADNDAAFDLQQQSPSLKTRPTKRPSFPFWPFSCLLIVVALIVSPWVEIMHLWLLSEISPCFNAESRIQTNVALANALAPLFPEISKSRFQKEISETTRAYGAKDVRPDYVQLCYAASLAKLGNTDAALQFARPALEYAKASGAKNTQFAFTTLFQSMAEALEQQGRRDAAIDMYKAAISTWDASPGRGTKTNCEADLALALAEKNDFAGAAHYMQMAYDQTRNWGSGHEQYTIFRAVKLSYYYRHTGDFSNAVFYARVALNMVKLARFSIYSEDAQTQFRYSQIALKNHKLDPED